jgi:hypothetical protein
MLGFVLDVSSSDSVGGEKAPTRATEFARGVSCVFFA